MSLLTIECTCVDGTECETFIVSLSSTGVNTNRIWQMETFMKDLEACGADLTVKECHRLMDKVEHDTKGGYTPLQSAFASALACSAFVFLLGGGVPEMICAFVGAGVGQHVRRIMGAQRITHVAGVAVAAPCACVTYPPALMVLGLFGPSAASHEASYIGAMLFVIPGFPLITSGLDIAKMGFKSGIERQCCALTVILVATLFGWLVASIVHLAPNDFVPLGIAPVPLALMRAAMSFCGVFGFSIMFSSPLPMAATAGAIGAVANTLRLELVDLAAILSEMAAFVGALAACPIASAVRKKLTFPRISLTVPGLYMYRAIFYLASCNISDSLTWMVRAALIVVFLPIGLAAARIPTDRHWRYLS